MKICVAGLRGFPDIQGGVEKHCEALYPRMTGDEFIVFRRKPYLPPGHSNPYNNIRFIDLGSTRIAGFETLWHTFRAALRIIRLHPDAAHIHNIGPGLFIPLIRLFGIPVVLTYHSPNYEHKKWGPIARAILRLGESLSLRGANRIIFVNRAQMEKYPQPIREKSVCLPNGISISNDDADDASFIRQLGLCGKPYILAVGRLTPEKGFEYLVEAVNSLPQEVTLVIAGGADHSSAYLGRLKDLDRKNRTVFAGNLTSGPLNQLYRHASLFVLSSVNEGFPLVMLEAMAHRLPILASRIPATDIPQIADSRRFRPSDVQDLARAISENLPLQQERIDYDLADYDWERIARATASVLREAAGK